MKLGKYDVALYKAPLYLKLVGRRVVGKVKTSPAFVVGNQRSGTTMLLSKLDRHFWIDIFHETSSAMKNWKLRPFSEIDSLIAASSAKVCIFKPLEDSHRINEMLQHFDGSKAMFMFRDYFDVINSSMKLGWGPHLKQYIGNINAGRPFEYSGPLNLTLQNVELVRKLYDNNLSEESCAGLIWYLRNSIYFDRHLEDNPAVLLIQYENVVTAPHSEMRRILEFLQLPLSRSVLYDISARAISKAPKPRIDKRVDQLCGLMYERLGAALSA